VRGREGKKGCGKKAQGEGSGGKSHDPSSSIFILQGKGERSCERGKKRGGKGKVEASEKLGQKSTKRGACVRRGQKRECQVAQEVRRVTSFNTKKKMK